jgi:hypothetical protein
VVTLQLTHHKPKNPLLEPQEENTIILLLAHQPNPGAKLMKAPQLVLDRHKRRAWDRVRVRVIVRVRVWVRIEKDKSKVILPRSYLIGLESKFSFPNSGFPVILRIQQCLTYIIGSFKKRPTNSCWRMER